MATISLGIDNFLSPMHIEWANYPTNVNKTGEKHFDLLTPPPSVRRLLEDDAVVFFDKIKGLTMVENWVEQTTDFLMYR